jgi:hypothetical protein
VRQRSNEDGMALVMSLGILLVLTILGAVVTTYTTAGQRTASRSSSGVSAYSLAEAGINNAMSVLAKPGSALDANLLPHTLDDANVSPYDGGTTVSPPYVKWWGTFDQPSKTWALTSIGYMRNPAGGSRLVTRRISVTVRVRPGVMQPTSNPAWNYIIATRTSTPKGCDESLNNSVNIQSPMYVVGNLCLNTPSQISGGPLQVQGSMTLDVNTNVGSSGTPLNEVHVRNGCSYKTGAYVLPKDGGCAPSQKVWASVVDGNPIDLTLPTADFASWYTNSAPGPRQACSTQSGTVPVFDNNTAWDNSVGGNFNLTPSASDYSCTVLGGGGTVVGQLSWNHTSKTLTIVGTVFIDGSVTVNYGYQNVPVQYNGTGTIYVGGTFLIQNTQLCATITAANDTCDFLHWDPNSRFLVIVANGSGGQVPVGDSIQLVSSSFEGGLFATNAVELDTHSQTEGPMIGGTVILDNTVYANTWPLVKVPVGMPGTIIVDAPPDPPGDFSG